MNKKLIRTASAMLAVFCIVSLFCGGMTARADEKVTINVYNWGQYISDGTDGYIDVNKAFTEATGIEVNYLTYDTNETMYTKLKTGGSSYDVIIPSDYMIARLISEDMLAPLNFDNIPNYKYIDEAYKNTEYDPENIYSVPYTWGSVGVIYNTKFVDEADTGSWDLLWNEKYSGKILMFDNPRDAFGIAELLLGYDLNTESEDELRAAAAKLTEQHHLVQSYVMDQIFNQMEHEEAWIAPYYAGDFLLMNAENENLAFYYPTEGFNVFIDAMCIPATSDNKEAAEAYINFLCDPAICGENLSYLGYSVPSTEAREYLDEDVGISEVAYPSDETLARSQSFLNLSAETTKLMDSLWLGVKTSGGSNSPIYIIGIAVVAVLAIVIFIYRNNKLKKRREHYGSK
ncbi:MAG: spermidine/putrescine ABC transporter substrate-binding protein [Oscillospiraceae bacterium]|nr:spermidine/putrescine ABC transporter substrate-binding protein [Oscillospiraceae bacterium]